MTVTTLATFETPAAVASIGAMSAMTARTLESAASVGATIRKRSLSAEHIALFTAFLIRLRCLSEKRLSCCGARESGSLDPRGSSRREHQPC